MSEQISDPMSLLTQLNSVDINDNKSTSPMTPSTPAGSSFFLAVVPPVLPQEEKQLYETLVDGKIPGEDFHPEDFESIRGEIGRNNKTFYYAATKDGTCFKFSEYVVKLCVVIKTHRLSLTPKIES
jgi:hypothetical protein